MINQMIREVGEAKTKAYLRDYFSKPENIDDFSLLFPEHIQTEPPSFHLDIYQDFSLLTGFAAKAAPRGFSKSTITDLVLLCWAALNAKRRFIILISDTHSQATMLMESVKAEIETNDLINWLYENPQGETWSENEIELFGVNGPGERLPIKIIAKGAGMKIRGLKFLNFRPDLIIFDDLENDEAVQSADRRRKLKNWLVRGVIPALSKDGCIWYIGTVLHRDSLLSNILDKKDEFASWRSNKYQAIIDGNTSLWPDRFDVTNLLRMRDDPTYDRYIGPLAFAQEMMNNPLPETDLIFQQPWIDGPSYNFQDLINRYSATTNATGQAAIHNWLSANAKMIIGSVDPAISEKTTADYWAMATIMIANACPLCEGNPPGHILQLDMHRVRESDPVKQVNIILDQYQMWKHDKIRIETVAYQHGLYQLTRRLSTERSIYPPIRAFTPDRDKHRRAIIFSAVMAGKIVHLRNDHILWGPLQEEILNFPQAEHDDMLDALMSASEQITMKIAKPRAHTNKPTGF